MWILQIRANETQEYTEECDFTKDMRTSLDLQKKTDRLILWRRITRALRDLYNGNNKNVHKDNEFDLSSEGNKYSVNKLNQNKGSEVPPVTSEETCPGNCDGKITHAVEANIAHDMSVFEEISD